MLLTKCIFLLFSIFIFLLNISYSQISPIWQVSFNDSIPEANYSEKSKLDNDGNIVIVARGTNNAAAGVDYVIIKYNSNGIKLWNRRFNGTGSNSDYPANLVIDKFNNIYVTGRSWGGATRNDYLTLKYSPDGVLLWSQRFNWIAGKNDEAYAIAIDSNSNVYVTGIGTFDLFNGNERYDMVTVKYDTDGNQKWVRSFSGYTDAADWGYSVVCDKLNNVYVSGFTYSTNLYFTDIISIKYDSAGNEIWQRRFYNNGDDFIRPLMSTVDNLNNLIVASYYRTDSTRIDYLTYKYDTSGNLLWSNIYDGGAGNTDWITDIKIDNQNNVYITGSSYNAQTRYDYFTIKYSYYGEEIWRQRVNDTTINFNNNSSDEAPFISIDSRGNAVIFGTTRSYSAQYTVIIMFDDSGNILTKFTNTNMKTASSINIDNYDNFIIVGINDPKTLTAKYLNVISSTISQNVSVLISTALFQNFPNPFNPKTIIKYQLDFKNYTKIKIYDIIGIEIITLVNEKKNAGSYNVEFDGSGLPSGIYFYSLYLDNNLIDTKKMFLIK